MALVACLGGAALIPSTGQADAPLVFVAVAPSAAEQAQVLFKSGVSRYQMSDYQAAIEKFSQAFEFSAEIADTTRRARVLHALQFNLARAHMKSYGIDKELSHLRTALDLLNKYLVDEDLGTDEEARTLSEEARVELEAREVEARALAASGAARESRADGASESSSGEGLGATDASGTDGGGEVGGGEVDGGAAAAGRGLSLGGYASLGLAGASLGLMIGGMVLASKANAAYVDAGTVNGVDAERTRGELGNALAISGGIAAAVFTAAGVGMVMMGRKQKARASQFSMIQLSPAWSLSRVGLSVRGRF